MKIILNNNMIKHPKYRNNILTVTEVSKNISLIAKASLRIGMTFPIKINGTGLDINF